jgi:hypothetical protein
LAADANTPERRAQNENGPRSAGRPKTHPEDTKALEVAADVFRVARTCAWARTAANRLPSELLDAILTAYRDTPPPGPIPKNQATLEHEATSGSTATA